MELLRAGGMVAMWKEKVQRYINVDRKGSS